MSKNKNLKKPPEILGPAAQRLGLLVMGAAMVLSTIELPDDVKRVILPNQPEPVWVSENEDNNPIRREREETAPHFISYSEVQRTASRSGRT